MKERAADRYVIVAVGCGRDHTLALLDTGRVLGWGGDGSGRITVNGAAYCGGGLKPAGAVEVSARTPLVSICAGHGVSLGITAAGQGVVWGANAAGMGTGLTPVATAEPSVLEGVCGICTVAAGEFQFGAIDAAGAIYTWGLGWDGALGRPADQINAGPARIPKLPRCRQLAVGNGFMIALAEDGRLYSWGSNAAGQLGLGHLKSSATPQPVAAAAMRFRTVAAGATHALAVTPDGQLFAWGSNHHGQLGHANAAYSTAPSLVRLSEPVRAVAAGMHYCLAIGRSARVYAWGWNGRGQLGLGDTADRHIPVQVSGLNEVQSVAAGLTHAVALTSRGLFGWGSNESGQIGGADRMQPSPVVLKA